MVMLPWDTATSAMLTLPPAMTVPVFSFRTTRAAIDTRKSRFSTSAMNSMRRALKSSGMATLTETGSRAVAIGALKLAFTALARATAELKSGADRERTSSSADRSPPEASFCTMAPPGISPTRAWFFWKLPLPPADSRLMPPMLMAPWARA